MLKKPQVTIQEAATICICQKARIAARAVTRVYDEALRSTGLRSTQFTVLVAASVAGGIPLGKLAGILGLERTTLSRNLAALEKGGLIRISNVDGRTRKVVISHLGAEHLEKALPLWDAAQQKLREKFEKEDWAAIYTSLAKLAEAA
jgi:DNA-binding MarR family transcriptional regulator